MPTEMKLCGITAKVTKAQIAQTLVRRPVLTTYIIIVFIFVSVCLNPVRFEARYEQRMMATHTSAATPVPKLVKGTQEICANSNIDEYEKVFPPNPKPEVKAIPPRTP